MFNISLNNRGDNRVLLILLVIDKVIMLLHNQNQKDKRKEKDNLILSVMYIHKNEFNSIKLH